LVKSNECFLNITLSDIPANLIEDLSAIAKHYEEISALLKERLREAVLKAETDLLRNPFAFSKVSFKDFRRIILKKFPYKIIYRVEDEKIHVFAVLHQRRSNRNIRKRLKK
jgi:plasmid stabilization system protein ParE